MPSIAELLRAYLSRFTVRMEFADDAEVAHWFTPRPGVVSSFVVEAQGVVDAFASYYQVSTSVLNHATHKTLHVAYSFYNVPSESVPMETLLRNLLIEAKNADGQDVFNALEVMDNTPCFSRLKFGVGDGVLNYFLYNWSAGESVPPAEVGMVLV